MFENQGEKDNYLRFARKLDLKYSLLPLSEGSCDFEVIKKSFHNTSGKRRSNLNIERIWRVIQKNPRKPDEIRSDKILVFHGTPYKNVLGILRNGFRSSVMGRFGPGVYHSNYFSKCIPYARNFDVDDGTCYFFVNEIPTIYIKEKSKKDNERMVLPNFYCHKYLSNPNVKERYVRDSNMSFINIAEHEKMDGLGIYNTIPEYVASSNVVIPKYLVLASNVMKKLVKTLVCRYTLCLK